MSIHLMQLGLKAEMAARPTLTLVRAIMGQVLSHHWIHVSLIQILVATPEELMMDLQSFLQRSDVTKCLSEDQIRSKREAACGVTG